MAKSLLTLYNYGIRTRETCEARSRAKGHTTLRPYAWGHPIDVDADALMRVIVSDGRPMSRIEDDAGLSAGALWHVLRRGGCKPRTLDKLCDALGVHDSEITREVA